MNMERKADAKKSFGFRPQSSACAFGWAKLVFMIFFLKFIDPQMLHCHLSKDLHCNYNGKIGQKFDFVKNAYLAKFGHIWHIWVRI